MTERDKVERMLHDVGAKICPKCDGTGRAQKLVNICVIQEYDCDVCNKKGVIKDEIV